MHIKKILLKDFLSYYIVEHQEQKQVITILVSSQENTLKIILIARKDIPNLATFLVQLCQFLLMFNS